MKGRTATAEFFPLSVHYYRQPTPLPGEWDGDLRRIREMGIRVIQLRPQWRWHERTEGRFLWDDLDRLFELAGRHGLKIAFKFMLECAPDWLFRDYPATRMRPDGSPMPPVSSGSMYVGGWLPCFDVPEVRERGARFVRTAVERYRERSELYCWHAWNEPRARPRDECACPASRESYRSFLRARFGTVEELNEHLGKCWASLDDVRPPVSDTDYAETFLWRQWAATSVASRVKLVADACRNSDPDHPVMAHVGCASIIQNAVDDTSDDVLNAAVVDIYGTSLAAELDGSYGPDATALNCDWIRSVAGDGRWWVNEAYVDPSLAFRRAHGAAHVRHVLLTPVAHGAAGVMAWQYRPERYGMESGDDGLVDVDGAETDRGREAARVGSFLAEHGHLFTASRVPTPEIVVLYDFRADLLSSIEGRCCEKAAPLAHPYSVPVSYAYKRALTGAYRLFHACGHQVAVVDSRSVQGRVDGVKLLYMPCPYFVGEDLGRSLMSFVRSGGTLVAEAGLGLRGENTWLKLDAPGPELTGLGYRLKKHCRPPDSQVTIEADLAGGYQLRAGGHLDVLETQPDSPASVRGTFREGLHAVSVGMPAVLEVPIGSGRALLLAFSPGMNAEADGMEGFLSALAADAGVEAPLLPEGKGAGSVTVRRLLAGDGRPVIFLRNVGEECAELDVSHLCGAARDIWQGCRVEGGRLEIPAGEFSVLLAERG
jgi:beta-galactosidase